MQYRTHQLAGVCAGLVAGVNLVNMPYDSGAIATISVVVLASTIGSAIPDIDEPNSKAGRKIWPLSKIIKRVFGHRMITHTPIFVLGIIYGFYLVGQEYVVHTVYFDLYKLFIYGFIVGYISHFVMDSLNPTGIMYLWPLSKKRFSIMKLKTGKNEWFVRLGLVITTIIYFYFLKLTEIHHLINSIRQ